MTNREFYKEQILDIACSGNRVAIDKDGKLCACNYHFPCHNCTLLDNTVDCKGTFQKWCNSEYVESCPFEKDELVEVSCDGTDWVLRYFSHIDEKGCLGKFVTFVNGKTSEETTNTVSWEYCRKYGTFGGLVAERE